MDPRARYALTFWQSGPTIRLRLLTDRRIALYERQGRYREQQRATWLQRGNRLVYSA
jgi:hypothetical protein